MLTGFNLERSRKDVRFFYEWLGYTWGDHIGEWMDMFGDRKGSNVHRVCVIAPRDHSKSTTLRIKVLHQALFEKWRDKPFTCWLFSASKDLAARRLEEMKEDLKRHPELRKFIHPKRGTKLELRLTNGAVIRGTGVGAAIRGEHPACIVLDDVLDDMGDMNHEGIRHWFRKKITPMLSPETSIYCVGTPMSLNDLYHTEMLENKAWKSGTWSALPNWAEHRSDSSVELECLWPEYRPLQFLLEQKEAMGELAFVQEYLCKVVDDESAVYKRHHLRKNMDMEKTIAWDSQEKGKYVIGFDPAQGLGRDYSVMVVLRQDEAGDIHFMNMWRRNDFAPDKQCEVIAEWTNKFGRCPLAAEDVGFQRLYQSLLERMGHIVEYRPSKVSNKGLKQSLLNRVRVWFEQGKVHWPYGDIETRNVVNQLLDEFDSHVWKSWDIEDVGKHNDTVMAFAHAIDQFDSLKGSQVTFASSIAKGEWMGGKVAHPSRNNSRYPGLF